MYVGGVRRVIRRGGYLEFRRLWVLLFGEGERYSDVLTEGGELAVGGGVW